MRSEASAPPDLSWRRSLHLCIRLGFIPNLGLWRINSSWADLFPSGMGEHSGITGCAPSDFKGVTPAAFSGWSIGTCRGLSEDGGSEGPGQASLQGVLLPRLSLLRWRVTGGDGILSSIRVVVGWKV